MNTQRLSRATVIGTLLQLAMVIAGHFMPLVKSNFMYGGLAISALAGALTIARSTSWGGALTGGAIAGGVCAFLGIAVSCALGDVPAPVLLFGTVGSAVTGVVGALVVRALRPASREADRPSAG